MARGRAPRAAPVTRTRGTPDVRTFAPPREGPPARTGPALPDGPVPDADAVHHRHRVPRVRALRGTPMGHRSRRLRTCAGPAVPACAGDLARHRGHHHPA